MIFREDHRLRHLVMVVMILGGTLYGSLWYADKLPDYLNFSQLKSQVLTSLSVEEQTFLNNLKGISSLSGVVTTEDLQQKFIQTLLLQSSQFDKTNATAAQNYLKTYYGMTPPIPPAIDQAIAAAVQKFLSVPAMPITATGTSVNSPDFLSNIQTILTNHQAAIHPEQASERSKTARGLLDAFIKQL